MTKQSILGKLIFLVICCVTYLLGDITATVDKPTFYQGDEITLEIKAEGGTVEFSEPRSVGNFKITGSSKSEQIAIINGKTTKNKSVSYRFSPNTSMTIPPILVKIDGKNYKTNPIKIEKIEPTVSKPNDDFQLILTTSKKRVYVGEPIVMTILFKQKADLEVLDAKLEPFTNEGFLVKQLENGKPMEKNGYTMYQNNYILYPQRSGNFTIQNQLINVATRERKTNFMIWKRIFSSDQTIEVLPLPNKITIQGDYKIESFVDKKETTVNAPVNLTIKVEGFGNIDDIREFALELPNEVAYSTKPQIKTVLKNGKYGGIFIQKISIIGENDFKIPPFSLQYFDPQTQQIKKIATMPIDIKVKGVAKEAPIIELKNKNTGAIVNNLASGNDDFGRYLYGLIGFFIGLAVAYIFTKKSKWKKADTPLIKQIKIAKNDKELYNILLPYAQNNNLKSFLRLLEENIYKGGDQKIDKKALVETLEDTFEKDNI